MNESLLDAALDGDADTVKELLSAGANSELKTENLEQEQEARRLQ